MIDTCAPRTVAMNTRAGSLTGEDVGACHDPVKGRIVVQDAVEETAKIREQLADLFLSRSQTPLREKHLRIVSKEFQDACAARSDTFVVESLQIFQSNGFALFICHGLPGDRHSILPCLSSGCDSGT